MRCAVLLVLAGCMTSSAPSDDDDPPPHLCLGRSVEIRTEQTEPESQREALRATIEAEVAGAHCANTFNSLSCTTSADACREVSPADAAALNDQIHTILLRDRPDLVTESNPQVDDCPCRAY
jgi:hypothetical protein